MIPSRNQCLRYFDTFDLPAYKRVHVQLVTKVALFLAQKLVAQGVVINLPLVEAAALLHDIDKNIPKKAGERHPAAAVRVLRELDLPEVATIVKKHSVHCILDPQLVPQTWEEKLVFVADKMVKQELIGVEARFKLWFAEQLPETAVAELNQAYPRVKALETEVLRMCEISLSELHQKVNGKIEISKS